MSPMAPHDKPKREPVPRISRIAGEVIDYRGLAVTRSSAYILEYERHRCRNDAEFRAFRMQTLVLKNVAPMSLQEAQRVLAEQDADLPKDSPSPPPELTLGMGG